MILDVISWVLIVAGSIFVLGGSIGVLRFPDFYTRIHAAGVTDTLGAELILLGMACQSENLTTLVKIFFIALFLLLTSPVATHALAHAAWVGKLNPMLGRDLKYKSVAGEDEVAE